MLKVVNKSGKEEIKNPYNTIGGAKFAKADSRVWIYSLYHFKKKRYDQMFNRKE